MPPLTLVHVSDPHLSPTHGYFAENWDVFVEEMQDLQPDLIVVGGDLAFNGPERQEDLAYAARQIGRLPGRVVAIPGNHDLGEREPCRRPSLTIDDAKLEVWRRHLGADRFDLAFGCWRLIGLNSEILGTGLEAEGLQERWLRQALADAAGRPIGLFMHKPLFIFRPDEEDTGRSCLPHEARAALLDLLGRHDVRFVASGHLHRHRETSHAAMELVWAPSTGFIFAGGHAAPYPGRSESGYLLWRFEGEAVSRQLRQPPLFINYDFGNWIRSGHHSIDLPERPVRDQKAIASSATLDDMDAGDTLK